MPQGDLALTTDLADLWSVGRERAAALERLGLRNVLDLLLHRPRRYEDRRNVCKISQLEIGVPAVVSGQITAMGVKRFRGGSRSVFEFVLDDGTARVHCRWWNQPFRESYYKVGERLVVYGKPKDLKPRTMDQPETETIDDESAEPSIHVNRVVPVYPLTEGIMQRWLRGLIYRTLPKAVDQFDQLALPAEGVMLSMSEAVRLLHMPPEIEDAERARARLALEELLRLQLELKRRRKAMEAKANSPVCGGSNDLIRPFLAKLPFKLTSSQTAVLKEIREDLSRTVPMRRLLQGDVGAGKTVVAGCAALMAMESGCNVILMAPTEILAEQHFQRFHSWLTPLGIDVSLRTGAVKSDEHPSLLSGKARLPKIVIGTHALIQSSFEIENLGLVIIDEQHKFGVSQREKLVRKGRYPHLLVMTATPIPRTLGLTLYGDLDISVIHQLPSGRGKIRTYVRPPEKLPQVWQFVREKLDAGQQAYIVHPRVEESSAGVKAVLLEHKNISAALAPHGVGLLHGRLAAEEKERVMSAFRKNKLQALLATPLIEVGVDVPNATIMVIENAEQFGLAQLHQLRGRIGRGALDSYCVLVASAKTAEARERLEILEKTSDGFEIAEADLRLRGPGELLGQDQAGAANFKFADLAKDSRLVEEARALAVRILAGE
ncbi:MAG TPA: ATP-dependent DNA helicase RecG [Methylomirabilota bacterium]|nr:ATP-dependent DNA helicase RecG [Methylomirabilota bacterium]